MPHTRQNILEAYGFTVEEFNMRQEGRDNARRATVSEYLNDTSQYDLGFEIIHTNQAPKLEDIKIKDWHEYLGRQAGACGEYDEIIDTGRKIAERLRKFLRNLGMDVDFDPHSHPLENGTVSSQNKEERQKNLEAKWEYIRLVTFLYKFSKKEKIKLQSLFKAYSIENIEIFTEREITSRNGKLLLKLSLILWEVISKKAGKDTIGWWRDTTYGFALLCENCARLEELLWVYINRITCDINTLREIKDIMEKDIMEKKAASSKASYSIYIEFLLHLNMYSLRSESEDLLKVYEYIDNMEIPLIDFDLNTLIYLNAIPIEWSENALKDAAKDAKKLFCDLLHISYKKYDNIVKSWLVKYINVMDSVDVGSITALHLLIMINEIASGLNHKLEKEMLHFYKYTTTDSQKTLRSFLKNDNRPIIVNEILKGRIFALYYSYMFSGTEYSLFLQILECINRNKIQITENKDMSTRITSMEIFGNHIAHAFDILNKELAN